MSTLSQLNNTFVVRQATAEDRSAAAEFVSAYLNPAHAPEVSEMLSGQHPTTGASDFVLAFAGDTLIATAGLIAQQWAYADIPFGVGNVEFVATHPDYRRQGVMTAVMNAVNQVSAARGQLAQSISGIPWFYRQFGYEYALARDGARTLYATDLPHDPEKFTTRRAAVDDIPAMLAIYNRMRAGKLVTALVDEARWRHDMIGRPPGSDINMRHYVVTDTTGQISAYYKVWGEDGDDFGARIVNEMGFAPGVAVRELLPAALRVIHREASEPHSIQLSLGESHPAYDALDPLLRPLDRLNAWYIRVGDLPAFLRQITPVLERRLTDSVLCGYSGTVRLNFYQSGLRLTFNQGVLEAITPTDAPTYDDTDAAFPPHTFLKLVFGYRSLADLFDAYPDCRANDEMALLLTILFPKQMSWVIYQG